MHRTDERMDGWIFSLSRPAESVLTDPDHEHRAETRGEELQSCAECTAEQELRVQEVQVRMSCRGLFCVELVFVDAVEKDADREQCIQCRLGMEEWRETGRGWDE